MGTLAIVLIGVGAIVLGASYARKWFTDQMNVVADKLARRLERMEAKIDKIAERVSSSPARTDSPRQFRPLKSFSP